MDTQLKSFDDEPVTAVGIEIPGAAGGLRDAMEFDPIEFHRGEKVFIVLDCTVAKFKHVPITTKDGDFVAWRRVHVFETDDATFIDQETVTAAFEEQRKRIEAAKAKAERDEARQRAEEAGEMRIPGADPAADLTDEHDRGAHASGLVEGCPECTAEADAEAAGD